MLDEFHNTRDVREEFGQRMETSARLWRRAADKIATSCGYGGCSFIPLYHLASSPPGLTQVELSRLMQVSESSIVRILRPLLGRTLVSRSVMIGDARAKLIKIEPEGRLALDMFEQRAACLREMLFEGFTRQEIDSATGMIFLLTKRLSRSDNIIDLL